MTQKQFTRWKDFSGRMAMHGFPRMTPARQKRLAHAVAIYFTELERDGSWRRMRGWDTSDPGGNDYACDWMCDVFEEHLHAKPYGRNRIECYGRFYDQISCSLRAGIDLAAEPWNGVIGFTVGDLRRMYDGRIPLWISRQYRGGLARCKDDAALWL